MAIKNSENHKGINGWFNRSCQRWKSLGDKSAADWVNNPIGIVGGVVDAGIKEVFTLDNYTEGSGLEGTSLIGLNKLWRVKLLLNRKSSDKEKVNTKTFNEQQKQHDASNLHTTKTFSQAQFDSRHPVFLRNLRSTGQSNLSREGEYIPEEYKGRTVDENRSILERKQALKKAGDLANSIYIVSPYTSPYMTLQLQCRPNEIQVTPQGTWAAVSSMGRNNPFRMYTGGEDTIQLDICWYCNDPENRGEVVTKCRLLESWSKANGYSSAPPVLQLIWGTSDIYKKDFFILESASYKLTHFQSLALKPGDTDPINLGLYPNYATQTLVFKKVSSINRTWEDIVSIADLTKTQGISLNQ